MEKQSISFVLLTLVLGLFLGSVSGSLLHRVFGLEFLNRPLTGGAITLVREFYAIQRLEILLTPAGLLGVLLAAYLLYKKGKG